MKNILIRTLQALVLVAVASSFAHADNFTYFKKKAAAGGGGFSWSCTDAALMCESFNTSPGYDNTQGANWVPAAGGTSILNPDLANTTTLGCDTANVESLRLYRGDTNAIDYYTFTSTDVLYAMFWVKVVSANVGSSSSTKIVSLTDASANERIGLYIYNTGTVKQFIMKYYDTAPTQRSMATTPTITIGDWYKIEMYAAKNTAANTGVYWKINDGAAEYGSVSYTTRNFASTRLSFYALIASDDYYFDNVKVATSGPPSCN